VTERVNVLCARFFLIAGQLQRAEREVRISLGSIKTL